MITPTNPFDVFTPADMRPARRPLTLMLLERGFAAAGIFQHRPTTDSIVTFWDSNGAEPVPVQEAGNAKTPHPILWNCHNDTLVCRAEEDLITFTGTTRRHLQASVNQWNATESWPCAALTPDGALRATIRMPLLFGTTIVELAVFARLMTVSIGTFFSTLDTDFTRTEL